MRKNNFHNLYKTAGYTMVEVMIVAVILGVIATYGLTKYNTVVEKSRAAEGEQILYTIFAAEKRYATEHGGGYAGFLSQLDIDLRPSENFGTPTFPQVWGLPATITRNGSYTLSINTIGSGTITCSGGPAGLCAKLGY